MDRASSDNTRSTTFRQTLDEMACSGDKGKHANPESDSFGCCWHT